jgi:hypothetical protein
MRDAGRHAQEADESSGFNAGCASLLADLHSVIAAGEAVVRKAPTQAAAIEGSLFACRHASVQRACQTCASSRRTQPPVSKGFVRPFMQQAALSRYKDAQKVGSQCTVMTWPGRKGGHPGQELLGGDSAWSRVPP